MINLKLYELHDNYRAQLSRPEYFEQQDPLESQYEKPASSPALGVDVSFLTSNLKNFKKMECIPT